jgi:hypothetical protein
VDYQMGCDRGTQGLAEKEMIALRSIVSSGFRAF